MRGSRLVFWCLGVGGALFASSASAQAEIVELRSGRQLDARRVEVREEGVRVTLDVPGGTARVTYRFHLLEPLGLIRLLERHRVRGEDPKADAAASLDIARLAFEAGLMAEAASRFARAAALDPSLAAARDDGIARIRDREAGAALEDLERRLRDGDALGVLAEVDAIRESALGPALTEPERLRVSTLAKVAQRLLDKAEQKLAAAVPAVGGAPGPALSLDGLDATARQVLETLDPLLAKARRAREAAADPDISGEHARRHLEVAGRALLDARRALSALSLPLPDPLAELAHRIRTLLVATFLDVAELHRDALDLESARRWLRAARVLNPESPRAAELQRAIDDDRAQGLFEPPPWYGPVQVFRLGPGAALGGCCIPRRGVTPLRTRHFHGALRFGGR